MCTEYWAVGTDSSGSTDVLAYEACAVSCPLNTALSRSCDACPAGRQHSSVTCTECSTGRFSRTGSADCAPQCPAGTFADVAGGTARCIECAAGKYIDVAGSEAASDCIECTAGKFIDVSGSDQASNCIECMAGKHVDISGSDEESDCIECVAGKYVEASGSNAESDCISCAAGKFGSGTGSSTASDCIDCVAGVFSSAGSGACGAQCPVGTFADVAGGTSACIGCLAGKYVDVVGSEAESDCIDCAGGTFSLAGFGVCVARCPTGSFADINGGTTACLTCVAGKYVEVSGSNAESDCMAATRCTRRFAG